MFLCLSLFLVVPFVLFSSYVLFQRHFLISVPEMTDVIAIVRLVNEEQVDDLLNQAREAILRANTSPGPFQAVQRARARILFEQLRSMMFNALVILLWANREQKKIGRPGMPRDEAKSQAIAEMLDAGPSVRLISLIALLKLGSWIVLDAARIKRLVDFTKMRSFAGVDVLAEYRRLARAAASLSSSYGPDAPGRLIALLLGRQPNS
jgi:hypothetical protein